MGDISLSKAVRSNLLSLQSTATMMGKTQERLSTGNKVNSALDNPTNFFTAQSLNSRASDMNSLMDSMANGIQTLEAADNGLTSITKTLESMQSTLRQARQDKSFQTESYSLGAGLTSAQNISFSGGAVGTTAVDISLGTAAVNVVAATSTGTVAVANDAALQALPGEITLTAGGNTTTYTIDGTSTLADLETALGANGFTVAFDGSDNLAVSRADGVNFTATGAGATALGMPAASTDGVVAVAAASKSVDTLVSEINTNDDLEGKVRASNDNGKLRIENLSTQALDIDGVSSLGAVDGTSSGAADILGNTVRADLADQFNELRDQLDKLSDDASFNGINLLRGDKLTITFNETGSSSIDIQTKDENSVNSTNLGVSTTLTAADLDADSNIDAELGKLKTALNEVRSQSSAFGSNLSIVQNRQDFTKSMINTLQTGAANLTLADMNEEAANLLALQTRQSLSSSSLSLASQADQSVLQLIR
jgi:flagellin